jgi:exodeoxyribonuclease VII large subunit
VVEPSLVQGKEAPKAIMAAFNKLQKQGIDVLIIARGGGSSEDLSAFNDEDLVRLVATSVCPVISAVGHEVDTTLIDLVADRRVSTPTAAAIASVPDKYEVYQTLDLSRDRLQGALEGLLRRLRERLDSLSKRSFFLAPESIYRRKREDLIQVSRRLDLAIAGLLQRKKDRLETSKRTLESLNPDRVLSRGFSLSIDSKGKPLTSAASVKEGESIKTRFKDGIINSIVTSKETDHGR